MNGRGFVPLLAIAAIAFGLGWMASQNAGPSDGADAFAGSGGSAPSFEEILAIPETSAPT